MYLHKDKTQTLYKTRLWDLSLLEIILLIIFYITGKKYPSIDFGLLTKVLSPILWRYSIFLSKSASIPPPILSNSSSLSLSSSSSFFYFLVSTSLFKFLIWFSISSIWTKNLIATWPTMKRI